MQLLPPDQLLAPRDTIPAALEQAREQLGNRPAVTVLSPGRREEQAVASLAQWAAKGAHLLEADLLLEPGDELLLDAPLSWPAAAVCLAAWWAGVTVVVPTVAGSGDVEPDGVEVAVCHASGTPPPGAREVLWLGDELTGAPRTTTGEAWTQAVQAFPDRPPAPRADAAGTALRIGPRRISQSSLLARARELGTGTAGLRRDRPTAELDAASGLILLALRPLVTGAPTVVLRGVGTDAATGERVRRWW